MLLRYKANCIADKKHIKCIAYGNIRQGIRCVVFLVSVYACFKPLFEFGKIDISGKQPHNRFHTC